MAYYAQGGQYPFFTVLRRSIAVLCQSLASGHLGQQPLTHARAKYLELKSRLGPRGPGTSACGESRGPGRTAQKSGTRAPPVGRPDSRGRAAPRWFRAYE